MDGRLANTWKLTVNEKKFIETALASNLRIDGRNPLEYRKITIKFGREDGSSEVQLGQTHVMGLVTGRPGESAVELGRIVDRGLRESRAVDTESLCVLAGKLVWAIRIDLHILDNGGRPECTLGGEDGQEVTVHPPEEREPLPLIVHHLPIAITFAFFGGEGKMVVDPVHSEEAVMGGRMTVTVNANGDICAIQKGGGEGVPQSAIMHCLQLASLSAESITKKIKNAVEAYNTERALRKIKRHPTSDAGNVSVAALDVIEQNKTIEQVEGSELSRHHLERLKLVPEDTCSSRGNDNDEDTKPSEQGGTGRVQGNAVNFLGGPSSWYGIPYSKGVDPDSLKASLASRGVSTRHMKQNGSGENSPKTEPEKPTKDIKQATLATDTSGTALQTNGEKTLKDAVKPKNKRRKRASPSMKGS
ncbi:EXOSOME COMPLEX EXONUCLEASE RIBOSOMAL RNA PROCESSING PROTEIN [Salix viminalis]|uniref:EXOSOME COMPLEX EXONUCLEASE RIBOSOMAL RNA PROCESSING PROTEIN n=1 Tax=Salix viminalis TaxID=40686 RepID=A0A9Q0SBB0_SALVM|nr:EXOSOME COMPLEX EXONUCLEASE RIBOSOMAL RNA PROCESSING PROTEIN [Salix viminalis]